MGLFPDSKNDGRNSKQDDDIQELCDDFAGTMFGDDDDDDMEVRDRGEEEDMQLPAPSEDLIDLSQDDHGVPVTKPRQRPSRPKFSESSPTVSSTKPRSTPSPSRVLVCDDHVWLRMDAKSIRVSRCRCHLPEKDRISYNRYVANAVQASETVPPSFHEELYNLMMALKLCDDDLHLHRRVIYVGSQITRIDSS